MANMRQVPGPEERVGLRKMLDLTRQFGLLTLSKKEYDARGGSGGIGSGFNGD